MDFFVKKKKFSQISRYFHASVNIWCESCGIGHLGRGGEYCGLVGFRKKVF